MDDQLLLDRAMNEKDPQAFEILYVKYYLRLRRRVARRVASRVDVEDLTQSVFVRLWETRARYEKTKSVEAYLYAVTNNVIAQHFREKRLQGRHVYREAPVEEATDNIMQQIDAASGPLCGCHSARLLEDKRIRVSQKGREAVRLRFLEGLSVRQAARAAGCSVTAFYSRLERAIKALRKGKHAGWQSPQAVARVRAESQECF